MSSSLLVATWNINSIRARIQIVQKFLKSKKPDILCLQEIKCRESDFPKEEFEKLGYTNIAIRGQKAYHGVAILSRLPFKSTNTRDFCNKDEARHVEITIEIAGRHIRLHNFYVPAGGDEPDRKINEKFGFKLDFLTEMAQWLKGREVKNPSILLGDLNIAPYENDVWSHEQLLNVVSHTPIEVEKLAEVRTAGKWIDGLRHFVPMEKKDYTWWSYRSKDWKEANKGRRLDHIWVTPNLLSNLKSVSTFRESRGWEKASDHAPVLAKLVF